jgi:Tol biopolymer transport system component
MSLAPRTRLGSYEIVGQLGAGGMGEVYRARDTTLNRDVAIKVLPELFASDSDRLARFTREAQTLAALNHPHIAAIYGLEGIGSVSPGGETRPPRQALVMELVEGEDLSTIIARGPIALADALPLAKQIAEALEAAHEQGIVHRDLKPANIKVRADGTVKVLDFGLAKAMDPAGASGADAMNSPTLTMRATQMGMVIGTAAYMAPEQAKGRAVDKRADIWAFGVVLFEMLSGTRGYEAEDVSETLAAVLTREVDWTKLPASTPPRLTALLRDCLVRDPKQRLRDMGEARRILDQLILGAASTVIMAVPASTAGVVAPPSRTARPMVSWAIAAVAILAAGAATWKLWSAPQLERPPVTRARQSFSDASGLVAISRDGTQIAYTRSGGTQGFHLELRRLAQFDAQPLAGAEGGVIGLFSPAGDWIAFSTADSKIKKVPATGGPGIQLAEGSFFDGATWGDDDTIVYPGAKGLMRMAASGGTPTALTAIDKGKSETAHVRPEFLPDGQRVLFTVRYAGADPQFAVFDLKKATYQTVAKGGDNGRYVDGYLLSVRSGTLFALPFDIDHLKPTGSEAPVVEGVSSIGPDAGTADYAVSRTGLLVYFESAAQSGTLLTWRDRHGVDVPLPGQLSRAWGTGSLSPDGHSVANAISNEKGSDIWVVDLARGTPKRLTFGGANDHPIWTPDGHSIIYGGTASGKSGLYRVLADGSSAQPQLVFATTGALPTSFTPDGETLLFTQVGANGRAAIMVLPLDTPGAAPHPVRESSAADSEGEVSPDGHWVAFTSSESGRPEIYVVPFPGPGPKYQISADGGTRERWSAHGHELFFWDLIAGNATLLTSTIQLSPFASTPPQKLFTTFSGTTWGVAPDGQHFLVESVSSGGTLVTVTNWFDELRRRAPAKK